MGQEDRRIRMVTSSIWRIPNQTLPWNPDVAGGETRAVLEDWWRVQDWTFRDPYGAVMCGDSSRRNNGDGLHRVFEECAIPTGLIILPITFLLILRILEVALPLLFRFQSRNCSSVRTLYTPIYLIIGSTRPMSWNRSFSLLFPPLFTKTCPLSTSAHIHSY